jgi:hypothetical protein
MYDYIRHSSYKNEMVEFIIYIIWGGKFMSASLRR